jgi:glutamate synthase (NADPH/NADH) small chain
LAHEAIPKRPVNIRGIEQVLARQSVPPEVGVPAATGFKVALVGLGPANVVAAARLARKGHAVHVFEQQNEFGGAVALIPSFRLRHAKTHEWVRQLLGETGVQIHTGVALGQDLKFESLREQYDAIILGIGAGKPLGLGIEGEEYGGVVDALQVLRTFNRAAAGKTDGTPPPRLRNTIVIGGGDVAADVVMWYIRTAAQCAKQAAEAAPQGVSRQPEVVNVVWTYRRGRAEMPVSQEVLTDAEDEINALKDYQLSMGITPAPGELSSGVYFHLRPLKVLGQEGKVCGIRFIRTRPGRGQDRSGRCIVEDIPGSEFTIPADSVVVLAVGQRPDPACLKSLPTVTLTSDGRVRVDATMKAAEGVYAVGDLVGGEILADAISHGRRAADNIHQAYLAAEARRGQAN